MLRSHLGTDRGNRGMRYVIAAGVLIAYFVVLKGVELDLPVVPNVVPTIAPVAEIADVAKTMRSSDREAMSQAYGVFARSVMNDPSEDSVFVSMGDVRRAHRAILLWIWRGYLERKPGDVPGLGAALEGSFARLIGTDDEPLNPSRKAEIAKALQDFADSF